MADCYAFADEAGNFDFSRNSGATRNFILTTVKLADPAGVAAAMTDLRMDLAWQGTHLDQVFHASPDPQAVRDEVFAAIQTFDFRVDATILDKRKAMPHLQSEAALYKMAWFLHFKHVAPRIAGPDDRLFVGAASVGTKKKRKATPRCGKRRRQAGLTLRISPGRVLAVPEPRLPSSRKPLAMSANPSSQLLQRRDKRDACHIVKAATVLASCYGAPRPPGAMTL